MSVRWITVNDIADPSSPHAELAVEVASFMLYKLSGEKYPGNQTVTEWYGLNSSACFACLADASVGALLGHEHVIGRIDAPRRLLRLRGRPVVEVDSVTTAAGELSITSYKLVNRTSLLLTEGCWSPATGTVVTYTWGAYPPAMGRAAAIRLADELVLMYEDPDSCALPEHVTSVTRQGMSFTLADPASLSAVRRTGIWEIDMFLATVNPDNARKRPKVFSPDIPRGERYN